VDRVAEAKVRVHRYQSGWSGVRSVILLYVVLLGGQGATFIVSRSSEGFVAEVAGTCILSGIVAFSALRHRSEISASYRRPGFGLLGYALILATAVPIVFAVSGYAHGLVRLFRIHQESELKSFEGRSLLWAFVLFAAAPAIFEEMGFRGVIFSLLRRSLDARETIALSAAAFGLLHLSVPMLITHVPLGLYLGWLRYRSGSLYPSMFAHFLHNALVVIGETWALLPGTTISS
jgi:membrane protease YdiL (CAAX protease family)